MDNFLRESLNHVEIKPSQSVWKNISKQLIILELIRFNFTNIGKSWLFSSLAVVATIGGITYYSMTEKTDETLNSNSVPQTESTSNTENDDYNPTNDKLTTESTSLEKTATKESLISDSQEPVNSSKPTQPYSAQWTEKSLNKVNSKTNVKSTPPVTSLGNEKITLGTYQLPAKPIETLPEAIEDNSLTINNQEETIPLKKSDDSIDIPVNEKASGGWSISGFYEPEWPLSSDDNYTVSNQLGVKAGYEFNRLTVDVGVGYQWGKTPSRYLTEYSVYDSVGFFYDIDYFEIVPGYPDSVIIHYTTVNIFDSVAHTAEMAGSEKTRAWIVIPVELGYKLIQTKRFELAANLNAQIGMLVNEKKADEALNLSGTYIIKDITTSPNPHYIQVGVGLENSLNVLPHWWIYAEPRVNYYLNNSFTLNGSRKGPLSFGVQIGIKYKL